MESNSPPINDQSMPGVEDVIKKVIIKGHYILLYMNVVQ